MRPRYSYDYRPGAAERSRRGVSFPVWLKSDILERDTQVFTLRLAEGAKAYPVDRVLETGIVNDRIGTEPILVIGDRASGSVRAYRRGTYRFERTREGWLEDNLGGRWSVEEEGLRNLDGFPNDIGLGEARGSRGAVVRVVWLLPPDGSVVGIG